MSGELRFVFDARYVRLDFHDGISRYSTELGRALARLTPVTFLVSDPRQAERIGGGAGFILARHPESLLEPLTGLRINRAGADVVFSPLQMLGGWRRRFTLILTLQDLIYYRHRTPPRELRPIVRLGWFLYHLSFVPQRLNLARADAVATISQTSKQEILATRLARPPVVVIPNAPRDLADAPGVPAPQLRDEPPRNLVYVGSFMGYKNVEVLVRGMAFLPGRTLHLASRIAPARERELRSLAPAGSGIVFHNGITDAEYARLLADNGLLVTASLDEGFGLPPAEALHFGVPVVVSDLPVTHEVVGPGGEFFDPRDPEDFARAVLRLDDLQTRRARVAAGRAHLAQFSWDASARTLLGLAERLTAARRASRDHDRRGRA